MFHLGMIEVFLILVRRTERRLIIPNYTTEEPIEAVQPLLEASLTVRVCNAAQGTNDRVIRGNGGAIEMCGTGIETGRM